MEKIEEKTNKNKQWSTKHYTVNYVWEICTVDEICAPEGQWIPAPLVTPVMLLMLTFGWSVILWDKSWPVYGPSLN